MSPNTSPAAQMQAYPRTSGLRHIMRAPPSRSPSNWPIPEGNTSALGPAHAEPLVPTEALGPPASPAAAAISALRDRCAVWDNSRCCFAVGKWVLPGRQNSVRRGRKPRKKMKIDQTLRSGSLSFEFDLCHDSSHKRTN